MKMKLNRQNIKGITYQGPGADYRWDTEVKAFALRIYPSGQKSFLITYRAKGRQRFYTFGHYGEMTADKARKKAQVLLGRVRAGEDPAMDRQVGRRAATMADLGERFLAEHAARKMKASSYYQADRHWRDFILPKLGRRKVPDITRTDIAELHSEMAGTPTQANYTRSLLNTAFNLAEVWGWRDEGSNPCRHVKRFKLESRERFLSEDELGRLADALVKLEKEYPRSAHAAAVIRLLVLTGCRRGEILGLRWDEVDAEKRCLRLSDSKTGPKTVYLNTAALEVLAGIERTADTPYVFPGLKPDTHLSRVDAPWSWVRDKAKLQKVRLHDLRHTYASYGVGSGLNLPVVGKLLGHSKAATTDRYAHLADDPVRTAAETIGATIDAAMKRQPKAAVVDLRR
jgi:integrase